MAMRPVWITLAISLVLLATSDVGAGPDSCGHAGDHAVVFFAFDRAVYALNDTVVMDYGIRNDGSDAMFVLKNSAVINDDFELDLFTRTGTPIPLGGEGESLPRPRVSLKRDDFYEIAPHTFWGRRVSFPVSSLISKPGRYLLQIDYYNKLSCVGYPDDISKLPALWLETPILRSDKAIIEFVAPRTK